jgi:hypothetical protein
MGSRLQGTLRAGDASEFGPRTGDASQSTVPAGGVNWSLVETGTEHFFESILAGAAGIVIADAGDIYDGASLILDAGAGIGISISEIVGGLAGTSTSSMNDATGMATPNGAAAAALAGLFGASQDTMQVFAEASNNIKDLSGLSTAPLGDLSGAGRIVVAGENAMGLMTAGSELTSGAANLDSSQPDTSQPDASQSDASFQDLPGDPYTGPDSPYPGDQPEVPPSDEDLPGPPPVDA